MGPITAAVNIQTKELYINPDIWFQLPDHFKRYIYLHELGHIYAGNLDENAANEFAIQNFLDRSSRENFHNSLMQFQEILSIYDEMPAHKREMIAADMRKVPNMGKYSAPWIMIVMAAVYAGYAGYKAIKSTNERKRSEKSARIAQENEQALLLFESETGKDYWYLYYGLGLVAIAFIIWLIT
jgi:hypothetical protein